jgi:hypothetical protein
VKTPVLLIVFNRPDTTQHVFNAIRSAKPKKLYVSSDGPRSDYARDNENNDKVKQIVKNVDWDCEVKYRFLESNLGCGLGPATAISWAFENEDALIILEDDCVPAQPFFEYCEKLLEKFKNDERIWLISGRSHHAGYHAFQKYDYLFSYFGHTWGWATWKRCWNNFDIDMSDMPEFLNEGGFNNVFHSPVIGDYYNKKFSSMFNDKKLKTHVWDYQWVYARLKNMGLCIVPSKNLIQNIGVMGVHSKKIIEAHKIKKNEDYSFKKEPLFITPLRDYEIMHFRKNINKKESLIGKAKRKLSKIVTK